MSDIRYYEILVEDHHNYWRVVGTVQGYENALVAANQTGKRYRVSPLPLCERYIITDQGRDALKERS